MKNMKIIADLHCHTVASNHAYSTIRENIKAAKKANLYALAITDHGVGCPDGPPNSYFENLTSLPAYVDGIRLLYGVEANIMDFGGTLDIQESSLKNLQLVIASFHETCIKPGTKEQHTVAYLKIAENPYVHIIGHPGTPEYAFDYEKVLPIFKKYKKIVEINTHTFICRKRSIPNCRAIVKLCKQYEIPIVVNSDAHSEFEVAQWGNVLSMLDEMDFPEELVINSSVERLKKYMSQIL